MNEKFPLIELEGDHRTIGFNHGKILTERILQTIDFYKKIFKGDEKTIFKAAKYYKSKISEFNNAYCEEIEAIAEGAEVNPLWIYALNSRTEILTMVLNECTAAYFRGSSILGQTWDWAEELEDLAVLMKIRYPNNHSILMMTEPGIIGKIGFNSYGVGVCLNFLSLREKLDGVPVHIILRAILDSKSIHDALSIIRPFKRGKASNILIGDNQGNNVDIEFAGDEAYFLESTEDFILHTNHYLKNRQLNTDLEKLKSSFIRFDRVSAIIKDIRSNNPSTKEMKKILLDRNDNEHPICRHYVLDEEIGNVGTVCTIVMDLPNYQMHITKGSPLKTNFEIISLSNK